MTPVDRDPVHCCVPNTSFLMEFRHQKIAHKPRKYFSDELEILRFQNFLARPEKKVLGAIF